jgi:hypothetical protein
VVRITYRFKLNKDNIEPKVDLSFFRPSVFLYKKATEEVEEILKRLGFHNQCKIVTQMKKKLGER